MASLSTHVLDTTRGAPAAGVVVHLHACQHGERRHLITVATNPDGRAAGPPLEPGIYELTFEAAAYFRAAGTALSDPPFFNEVVVRFGIGDTAVHYHVPLLLAPYSYATYRGS
ncbi:MAG: hydroxyisourate hydrolase [Terriglobia bacterium]|nr:MAG: hydroxyisourate hydrolase [Terriglobia bacterium]